MKFSIAFLHIFLFFITSCTYEAATPGIDCSQLKEGTVSFNKNIIPILSNNCATQGCHSGSKAAGNLNLDPSLAYDQLAAPRRGYLDSIQPRSSLLYSMLVSKTNPMPPNGKLSHCDIETFVKWMDQNALNN